MPLPHLWNSGSLFLFLCHSAEIKKHLNSWLEKRIPLKGGIPYVGSCLDFMRKGKVTLSSVVEWVGVLGAVGTGASEEDLKLGVVTEEGCWKWKGTL